MKKTIEELLSGNFRHEHPQLLFSQDKIEVTLKAGDVYKGELYFGTEDNQKIRGYITSSNRRVVPGTEKFSGTTVRLQYGIDGAGMHPGGAMQPIYVPGSGYYGKNKEVSVKTE